MSIAELPPAQLRWRGYQALVRELGAVGAIRFLQQFENGSGDYTVERAGWLGQLSVDEIVDRIDGSGETRSKALQADPTRR